MIPNASLIFLALKMRFKRRSICITSKEHRSVALMCTSLNNMAGGLERQILLTAESLSIDYITYIVSFDSPGDLCFYTFPNNVEWLKCGCGLRPHDSATLLERVKQLIFLRRSLQEHNIECLITFHHGLYIRSLMATLFTGIVNIVSERNSLAFYNFIKMRKNNIALLLSYTAKFRTVQLNAYVCEYPRHIRRAIRVIPNFLPMEMKHGQPALDSRIVLMVGRLENQKNFQALLNSMLYSDLCFNFKVKIAGDGSLRNQFINKYSKLIRDGSVELLGNVKEVLPLMTESSLLCFPSLWEGFPNVLIEALASGLPVVTTKRMSLLSSFVEHNVNGFIVDDQDIFHATFQLIGNLELLEFFSAESIKKYRKLKLEDPDSEWRKLLREAML